MLRLANEGRTLRVVDDQHCTPTSTQDLADVLVRLVKTPAQGLVHITNGGETTWCEFAKQCLRLAKIHVPVTPITSAEFGAPARRPAYSVLRSERLQEWGIAPLRDWREALTHYFTERTRRHS
jgi:dTDP-4-dehydrorhamnose reductase